MKNTSFIALLLFVAFHSLAQEDIQVNLATVRQLKPAVVNNFSKQLFIHGSDSIWLSNYCGGVNFGDSSNLIDSDLEDVQIVDSIDLNGDDSYELILFRKWSCYTPPEIWNEFGVGTSSERNEQYEVWDVKNNRQLLEFKSEYWYQRIVSTNVMEGSSFTYDISWGTNGNLHFEQLSGLKEGTKRKGTYTYDAKVGRYVLR